MAVKLTTSQLPELLLWLRRHHPHSYKLHGELRSHLMGHFPDLQFFVDTWPHPQAAVALVNPEGQQLRCRDYFRHSVEGVYGVREGALTSLLTDPAVVDWNTRTYFSCLSANLKPTLQTIAQQMGRSVRFDHNLLFKAFTSLVIPLPVPDGMVCRAVNSADVETVNSTWKFASDHSAAFIQELIRQYPSVCLTTEHGQHVGHLLGVSCDTLGMSYVSPHFRGKGYFKLLLAELIRRYAAYGQEVYGTVEVSNVSTVQMIIALCYPWIAELVCMHTSPQENGL